MKGNIKTDAFRKIEGVEDVKSLGNGRFQLFSNSEKDVRPEIFRFVVDQQLLLLEMQQESSSIEDIFQKLTKQSVKEG